MVNLNLSKSTYVKGLQCLKQLHLYKYNYDLRDPIDQGKQAIFDQGNAVGELAQALFANGLDCRPDKPWQYKQAAAATAKAVQSGKKTIYEAYFQAGHGYCGVDILHNAEGDWNAYEVKSSTQLHEAHLQDAAFQYHIIKESGFPLKDFFLVHIDNSYVRQGELDPQALFKIERITDELEAMQEEVAANLEILVKSISDPDRPKIPIGPHCRQPYDCAFMRQCWSNLPDYSVFDLSRIRADKAFDLYSKGIERAEQVPDDYPLTAPQRMEVDTVKSGKVFIDRAGLSAYLEGLRFPFYYFDIETINPAIPIYDGSRPYQQIPFQFSLHYKQKEQDEALHTEFLADSDGDPRMAFAEAFLKSTERPGRILTYNQSFESRILRELGRDLPQFSKALEERVDRMEDLQIPFKQRMYYHPDFRGSSSIKKVLPVLAPELSYDELAISEGGLASLSFMQLMRCDDEAEKQRIQKDLLAYCKMDTWAMVVILQALREL